MRGRSPSLQGLIVQMARPDVAKALNLSPDQIDKIQAVILQLQQGQDQIGESRRQMFSLRRPPA